MKGYSYPLPTISPGPKMAARRTDPRTSLKGTHAGRFPDYRRAGGLRDGGVVVAAVSLGAAGSAHLDRQRDPERVAVARLLLDGRLDLARVLPGRSSRGGVWVAVGLAAASFAGTPVLVRRSLRAAPAIEQALDDGSDRSGDTQAAGQSIAPTRPGRGSCSRRCPSFIPV